MKDLAEFRDVTDEEDRKVAFDKFIARQKVRQVHPMCVRMLTPQEKLREAESSTRSEKYDKHREKGPDRRGSMHVDRDERKDRDRRRDKEDRLSERASEREYHEKDRPSRLSRDHYDERDRTRRESGVSENDRAARKEEWNDRYAGKDDRSDKHDRQDKYERDPSDRRRDSHRDKGLDYGEDSSRDRKDRDRHEDASREKDQPKSSRRERKHATDFMDDDREPKASQFRFGSGAVADLQRAKKDEDVEEGEI